MGLIAEFTQLQMDFKFLYHTKNPDCGAFNKQYPKKSENISREVINEFKRSIGWHCSDCK